MSRVGLPEEWVISELAQVISLVRGITYKKEQALNYAHPGFTPLIRANNIQLGRFDISDLIYVPTFLIKEEQKLRTEDIVIAMSSGSKSVVGKSAQQSLSFECSFGAFCGVMRPSEHVNDKYVAHFTKSSAYRSKISELSAGANINNIKPSSFDFITIPVPSLVEQKIIAETLDTLLAQVDNTKTRLEQIPKILKRFRQAVLVAAINGEFTTQWRALNKDLSNWYSCPLGELVNIERGSSPRPIKDYITDTEDGVNWIKIGDVKEGYKYITGTKEKITKKGAEKSRKVYPGDLILSNSMSLGRAYIVSIEGYVHDGWFILRLPESIDTNYFYYLLSSSQIQNQFSELAVGGIVQNIRSELVKQAIVKIPTGKEQQEIVRRVEQLFTLADIVEKQVNAALARVNNLTQSILAKAFRGELTAQWREENPDLISGENSAAALLERIKAERAASGSKKATRKKA